MSKKKKTVITVFAVLIGLAAAAAAAVFAVNAHVKDVGGKGIAEPEEAGKADCIIVLGCLVKADNSLSDMLRDRLDRAIELYKSGAAPKIIMSGDHGREDYDEVNAMKKYAVENGVPSEDVFMNHAGFSTYETVYRAKAVFQAEKVIIVTQKYHLYRAVYIAEKLGLQVRGVASDYHVYAGQKMRDVREILARCKDFASVVLRPEPTYLGEQISLSGSGDVTNDK